MTKFRNSLPQLHGDFFLTDGGIETTLIFLEGIELPDFAAFTLLKTKDGQAALRKYFRTYAGLAQRFGTGLVLESATWRASGDWGTKLGYGTKEMRDANRKAVAFLEEVRNESGSAAGKTVVSGCVGPRGVGYNPSKTMSAEEAEDDHGDQIEVFQDTAADMVAAITMNYVEEALGITRAARRAGMPVAISFTVETDGRLSHRAGFARGYRAGRCGDVFLSVLLHAQLRSSDAFRERAGCRATLVTKDTGPAGERFAQESRRAKRIDRVGCWRSH